MKSRTGLGRTSRTGLGHTSRGAASSEGAAEESWSGGGSGGRLKAKLARAREGSEGTQEHKMWAEHRGRSQAKGRELTEGGRGGGG